MDMKDIEETSQFLVTEYKDSLINGFVETPSQFMIRMNVEPKVENYLRPLLDQVEQRYKKSSK
ncbi:hypothetical protein [Enterococcus caccae]|uniref:Uncharacterized protein n=1 Tax=Enterococcus caccae ATCC BAA-1240 TaxID=1158612 RepID=R3WET9_9ENTE|nr:hypothetical protein [Enterococcus caccae]EOL46376.1 hypothetical protein UC7_01343 [Enterococcus caccae ATCC BAA-1240]EOT60745.1 hypothetical protein I580_01645 [Enterococcus caccae ATCC BAA-1240]OJG27445.1 hypothetical protein RU98_GL002534 [Enterococcus caccae]